MTRSQSAPAQPRLSGLTSLQRSQRLENRQKLLDAAADAFAERSYAAATVDDIASRAKVSRATFYNHFDSKYAVALALGEQISPLEDALYDRLGAIADPSEAEIAEWVGHVLAFYEANRKIIAPMIEVTAIEPEFDAIVTARRSDLICRLGTNIHAFRRAASSADADRDINVEAHLLINLLGGFCYSVSRRWRIDRAVGIRVVARKLREFIAAADETR